MPTVDVWFPAVMALLGIMAGAILEHFFSRRNWLRQQQWGIREKYYTDLLYNLRKLRLSLQDRAGFFEEPGSEYSNYDDDESFKALAHRGGEAFHAIRELTGPACIFLSGKTVGTLEELNCEQWNAAQFSVCTAEYVRKLLAVVEEAEGAIVNEARRAVAT